MIPAGWVVPETALTKSIDRWTRMLFFGLASAPFLIGCGTGSVQQQSGPSPALPAAGALLHGVVYGGQNPISGGSFQLYVAGEPAVPTSGAPTGGFGQGASALLSVGSMTIGSSNNYWPYGSSHAGATCTYTNGNPNNCTSLPQSSSTGSFSITSTYTCPSSTSQVYLVASGGNPGLSGSVNNPYIALIAALGSCGNLSPSTSIYIDEVTTVGAVWALQNFMAAPTGIAASNYASQGGNTAGIGVSVGAPSGPVGGYGPDGVQTQEVGLANAFGMVNNLVNNATGVATPVNAWATSYPSKINAIADTLASCVNSDGMTSSACSTLMSDAAVGAVTPADTIQAAWTMAQNPAHNAATLIGLGTPSTAFQPALPSSTPNLDLTLEVAFAPTYGSSTAFSGASAVYDAQQIVIDEMGRAWVDNVSGSGNAAGLTAPFISELAANGAVVAGPFQSYTSSGGLTSVSSPCPSTTHTLAANSYAMAIDQNSYLWVPNNGEPTTSCGGSVTARTLMRIDTDTATIATGYWEQGDPGALTVDGSDNVWWGGANTPIQSFVSATSTYTFSHGLLGANGNGSTVDMLGNVWIDDGQTCTVGSSVGAAGVLYQIPSSTISSVVSIANGFYNSGDTSCTAGTQTTTAVQGNVQALAADGENGIWAVSENPSEITYFAPQSNAWTTGVANATTIPATGAMAASTGNLNNPVAVAVDGANHAWTIGNSINTGVTADSLGEFGISISPANGNINSILSLADYIYPSETIPFLHAEHSIAIDPSGNIWIAGASTSVNWIMVVVGAAAPVITPLALQTEYNAVGATSTPLLTASVSSLNFPNTTVGNAAASQSITLTNTGSTVVSLSSVTLAGTNPNDFAVSANTCSSYLMGGATCSLSVNFTPSNTATRSATLTIGNTGVVNPLSIALSGTAQQGTAPVAPVFSPVAGTYTGPQTLSITDAAYGSTIYYTTNGTAPNTSSYVYTQPFDVSASETVSVLVVASGYASSTTASAAYTISNSGVTTLATATVNTGGTQIPVGKSFLGFSMTTSSIHNFIGTSSGAITNAKLNPMMQSLMVNFAQYANGPILFRELNDGPLSSLSDGSANELAAAGAFYNYMKANTTYGIQYWFGLDLQTDVTTTNQGCGSAAGTVVVYAYCTAANDAYTIATSMPTGSVIGYELGNEPDIYTLSGQPASSGSLNGIPWNYTNFLASYEAIVPGIQAAVAAIPQADSALPSGNNGAVMGSPVWSDADNGAWTSDLPGFISSQSSNTSFSNYHYYPGYYDPPTYMVAGDFLMQSASINTSDYSAPNELSNTNGTNVITEAHNATNAAGNKLTVRIGEMNSVAGGGQPGVSNTFQGALWVMDQAMQYATYQVDGINIFNGSQYYAPFMFNQDGSYPNLIYSIDLVNPIYYGMLMTEEFLQSNAALLPVTVSTSYNLKAYASIDTKNSVRVLLINKQETTSGDVTLTVAGHGAASLTYLQATGNNYLASDYTSGGATPTSGAPTDEITIGGQTFKNSTDGSLKGNQTLVTIYPSGSVYTIPLPQASAVMVTLP